MPHRVTIMGTGFKENMKHPERSYGTATQVQHALAVRAVFTYKMHCRKNIQNALSARTKAYTTSATTTLQDFLLYSALTHVVLSKINYATESYRVRVRFCPFVHLKVRCRLVPIRPSAATARLFTELNNSEY